MAVASSSVLLAVFVTPVLYLLLRVFTYFRNIYNCSKSVQQWPGLQKHWHWLYGNLKQHPFSKITDDNRDTIGNETIKWYLDMQSQFPKGFYYFYGSLSPSFCANHPECAKPILKGNDPKPMTGGGYDFAIPWLGQGLVIANGKKWARNRRLLTPAFHFEILKPYMAIYNKAMEILLDKMRGCAKSGESFIFTENVSLCTLDILLRCAFSQESNCQMDGAKNPYVSAVTRLSIDLVERAGNPLLYNNFVYLNLTSKGRRHQKDCDFVHKVAEDVINQRRNQLVEKKKETENGVSPKRKYIDFLDILISARDEDGVGLTDQEIRNEVDTFLFAGHDTTAASLTWIVYTLAKNPEHQRKVQQEVDEIFQAKGNEIVEWEDCNKFKHLTLCIKEAMRLYPPATELSRSLEHDTEIDGRILKEGTQVDVHIYALHHHPDFWDKPEEFIPERFLPENSKDRDPFCYVPFAAGPRNCIGQNFAMHEIKLIAARMLYNFDIELDPDHEVNIGLESVLKTANDIKLKLKLRR